MLWGCFTLAVLGIVAWWLLRRWLASRRASAAESKAVRLQGERAAAAAGRRGTVMVGGEEEGGADSGSRSWRPASASGGRMLPGDGDADGRPEMCIKLAAASASDAGRLRRGNGLGPSSSGGALAEDDDMHVLGGGGRSGRDDLSGAADQDAVTGEGGGGGDGKKGASASHDTTQAGGSRSWVSSAWAALGLWWGRRWVRRTVFLARFAWLLVDVALDIRVAVWLSEDGEKVAAIICAVCIGLAQVGGG